MTALRPVLDEGFDIEDMVVKIFLRQRELLVNFFEVMGVHEFIFIERCGIVMGICLGGLQLAAVTEAPGAQRRVRAGVPLFRHKGVLV